ncbi:MAG TPA: family 1 glycosylhydrolase [Anaerolineales bacterium]|nr:family 1 glycosylhydrolase [Anaerolineales bacterium]
MMDTSFLWATGIEDTFIPHVRPGLRALDEYELTQHYKLWKRDFDLVAETGVKYLRWGIPWYRVQPAPDRWDWEWTDQALDYMVNVKGITPILDLMHYGTPLWLENSFINAGYPQRVAEYTHEVVKRYKSLVHYYTPLNEPRVNAEMCGSKAEWPPYLAGDDGYVKLTLALAKGIVLTTRAIKSEQPDAITVQVEALRHTFTNDGSLQEHAAKDNARQYLCFDLTIGRINDDHILANFLCSNGMTSTDIEWFQNNAVTFDLFGANFYPWAYDELTKGSNGSVRYIPGNPSGDKIALVLRAAYERYHMPIMITETSADKTIDDRAQWMDETLAAVRVLRLEGIPVVGYTWFPLFTMVDWAYHTGRRPLKHYLIHLGLYDSNFDSKGILRRHKTPLVKRYQIHIAQPMPPVSSLQLPTSSANHP